MSLSDITIVTACDLKYIEHLKVTLPNWIKYKKLNDYPFLIYVNGFEENDKRLDFLKILPICKIIRWEMPEATSQREKMLSSFVLGTAKDVETKYWVKIDADAYASNYDPLLNEDMKKYVICGHKWSYSYLNVFEPLLQWANNHEAFSKTPKDSLDPARIGGRRYGHKRVASYVQMHQSDFVKMAANLTNGKLPVPSHDTYLWYVANRLGLPIKRHNFKKSSGMTNKSNLNDLINKLKEVEEKHGS